MMRRAVIVALVLLCSSAAVLGEPKKHRHQHVTPHAHAPAPAPSTHHGGDLVEEKKPEKPKGLRLLLQDQSAPEPAPEAAAAPPPEAAAAPPPEAAAAPPKAAPENAAPAAPPEAAAAPKAAPENAAPAAPPEAAAAPQEAAAAPADAAAAPAEAAAPDGNAAAPAEATAPAGANQAAADWAQCGGVPAGANLSTAWTGPSFCGANATCVYISATFSQCVPIEKSRGYGCSALYGQWCVPQPRAPPSSRSSASGGTDAGTGGTMWSGPYCCGAAQSSQCVQMSDTYSQCKPCAAYWEQCGGTIPGTSESWNGHGRASCCQSGSYCKVCKHWRQGATVRFPYSRLQYVNSFFYQCTPN